MDSQLQALQTYLDIPYVRRIRRNHGLEHATIHLLARKIPGLRMAGRSDARGFWLIGEASTEDIHESVTQALGRMRGGEHKLAIHPNCGTNLVTIAMLGTTATFIALAGSEREEGGKWGRLPLVVIGLLFASLFGQPLGLRLQEHVTTLGDPADLQIISITQKRRGSMTMHRVETQST